MMNHWARHSVLPVKFSSTEPRHQMWALQRSSIYSFTGCRFSFLSKPLITVVYALHRACPHPTLEAERLGNAVPWDKIKFCCWADGRLALIVLLTKFKSTEKRIKSWARRDWHDQCPSYVGFTAFSCRHSSNTKDRDNHKKSYSCPSDHSADTKERTLGSSRSPGYRHILITQDMIPGQSM